MNTRKNPSTKLFSLTLALLAGLAANAAPAAASVGISGPPALSNQTTVTFEMTVPAGAQIRCNLDDRDNLFLCNPTKTYKNLKSGRHTFYARAIIDGKPQAINSYSFEIDLAPPRPQILSATPQSGGISFDGKASFTYGADEAVSGFLCQVKRFTATGDNWKDCPLGGYSASGLADGNWLFEVRAIDKAGNVSNLRASSSFIVDTSPPETDISDLEIAGTGAVFWLAARGKDPSMIAGFECRLDGGPWEDCSSGKASYSGLRSGDHVFQARAFDIAGRRDPSPAERRWAITAKGETIESLFVLKRKPRKRVRGKRVKVLFKAYGFEGDRFRCRLDKRRWRNCRPGKAKRFRIGKAKRRHRIVIVARDGSGQLTLRKVIRFRRV